MSILKSIKSILKSKRILFTTPSHDRLSFIVPESKNFIGKIFYNHDLSEVNGLDNLLEPETCILESMDNSAKKIGADSLFYLVNGSSSGVVAAMLAVLNKQDKVLVARNCHKSVINGLILSSAEPVWVLPELDKNWGIFNPIPPEKIEEQLKYNENIKALIITSPTYEGINSDIKSISEICHRYNTLLIVDEAHGALKSFAPHHFGENAIKLGADISVQSLHKTCGAVNPCAIMLCGKNIGKYKVQNSLNLITTTSPSFPLLAEIEATINYLFSKDGQKKIDKLADDISQFKKVFENNNNIEFCDFNDFTKILVKIKGLSGYDLSDILFSKYNIEDELTNNKGSLLLTGIGTKKSKLNNLKKALKKILEERYSQFEEKLYPPIFIPDMAMSPSQAYFKEKKEILLEQAVGKICAEIISEYPPGIPILIPGERIRQEHIDFLLRKKSKIYCCF